MSLACREKKMNILLGNYKEEATVDYVPEERYVEVQCMIAQVEIYMCEYLNDRDYGSLTVKATKALAKRENLKQDGSSSLVLTDEQLIAVKLKFGEEFGKTLHLTTI